MLEKRLNNVKAGLKIDGVKLEMINTSIVRMGDGEDGFEDRLKERLGETVEVILNRDLIPQSIEVEI